MFNADKLTTKPDGFAPHYEDSNDILEALGIFDKRFSMDDTVTNSLLLLIGYTVERIVELQNRIKNLENVINK